MTHIAFPFECIDVAGGVDVKNVLVLLLLSLFISLILIWIKSSAVLFSCCL